MDSIIPDFETMTVEKYFKKNSMEISCIDHMKMLGLGFACLNSKSISPEEKNFIQADDIRGTISTPIFVVTKNKKKYFMVIIDELFDLELAIYQHFKDNNMSIELIEYKIINSRFVGIYSYFTHEDTLRSQVLHGKMTMYEKLYTMKELIKYAMEFFDMFDPRNDLLQLNLLPGNLLLTKESFYKFRLIRFIRGCSRDKKIIHIPEAMDLTNKLNQRSSIVYVLGATFYFILFKKFPAKGNIDNKKLMIDFRKNVGSGESSDIYSDLIELIRGMMNTSPVDRPSLEYANNKMTGLESKANTLYYDLEKEINSIIVKMENEIQDEYIQYEEFYRQKVKEANLDDPRKNSVMVKSRWRNEKEKSNVLRKEYLLYTGRAEKCGYGSTDNQINFLDDYGMFSMERKDIQSAKDLYNPNESFNKQINMHKEEHEEHVDLHHIRIEFIFLIAFLLLLIMIVSSYFYLKNNDIVLYLKEDFHARLILS
jgi:hypothetical protein